MHLSLSSQSPTGRLSLLLLAAVLVARCTESSQPHANRAPFTPAIYAPDEVFVGAVLSIEVTVADPDRDQLRVYAAWGDGDTSDFGEFVPSGAAIRFEHSYSRCDTFWISARCHDPGPLFSEWSSPRPVAVREMGR